jgi:hypothetical protein
MDELKPCPFCPAGQTLIKENGKVWTGMHHSEPSSVSVQHWCEPVEGQPSRMIERVGRDRASAIAAWNQRADSIPDEILSLLQRARLYKSERRVFPKSPFALFLRELDEAIERFTP